jgi:hypothetical protein
VDQDPVKAFELYNLAADQAEIRQNLTNYITELFPTVFQSQPDLSRLFREISKHHRYLILFTSTDGANHSGNQNLITGFIW